MPSSASPPSRKVPLPDGNSACVPDPLPPALTWTPALVGALSDADRLIGRLAGEGHPSEGSLPLAKQRSDICRYKSWNVKSLFYPLVISPLAEIISIIKDFRPLVLKFQHSLYVARH